MHDIDPWHSAKVLLDRHGQRTAVLHATMRTDELEAAGNEVGRLAWMRILAAIEELTRTERRDGELLH